MMHDNISNNIRRVAYFALALLIILFCYVSYIQIIESSFLSAHPLNRRVAEYAKQVERGRIMDRNGEKLAYSEKDKSNVFHRSYPYGAIFAHIIGYDSEKYGKSGIESSFNGYLAGINNPERGLGPIAHLWTGSAGNNIILTLDAHLQEASYQALGNNRGVVIVIDPRTGALLAMVSKPSFDPNEIDRQWDSIINSAASPLLNRATQGLYPPGSIIKPMIADAALTEKVVELRNTFTCEGSLKIGSDYVLAENKFKAHGKVDLEEALAVSCNVTFGSLALTMGRNKVAKTFERFGFNRPIGEEMNELPSRLPEFSSLGNGDLAQVGIGQGSLLVTPLRMAMLASTFANKGVTMKPYIVSKIITHDGSTIKNYTPEEWLKPTSPQIAELVGKMMVTVVNEGTGSAARLSGVQVAGKTGTAENPHGASHAWFIGFAPADAPQVAIAVIVENGGAGGGVAAPVARQILAHALR